MTSSKGVLTLVGWPSAAVAASQKARLSTRARSTTRMSPPEAVKASASVSTTASGGSSATKRMASLRAEVARGAGVRGEEVEDGLAVLDAAPGGEALAEDGLGLGVVPVGAEQELALAEGAGLAAQVAGDSGGALRGGVGVDRPPGEGPRDLFDVLLGVAAVDAEGVELEELAAVVLVDAAALRGRPGRRGRALLRARLLVVEVVQHPGMPGRRAEDLAERRQHVRPDGVAVVGQRRLDVLASGGDVEVVEPEVGHHLAQLVLRAHRPLDLGLDEDGVQVAEGADLVLAHVPLRALAVGLAVLLGVGRDEARRARFLGDAARAAVVLGQPRQRLAVVLERADPRLHLGVGDLAPDLLLDPVFEADVEHAVDLARRGPEREAVEGEGGGLALVEPGVAVGEAERGGHGGGGGAAGGEGDGARGEDEGGLWRQPRGRGHRRGHVRRRGRAASSVARGRARRRLRQRNRAPRPCLGRAVKTFPPGERVAGTPGVRGLWRPRPLARGLRRRLLAVHCATSLLHP